MKDTFTALQEAVANIATEIEKVEAGNKSAGTRTRANLQTVKKLAQTLRVEIQAAKKAAKEATKTSA